MKLFKSPFFRILLIVLTTALEAGFVLYLFLRFYSYVVWLESILRVIGVILIVYIINNSNHLATSFIWIMLISVLPAVGAGLYLFFDSNLYISRTFRQIQTETEFADVYYSQDEEVLQSLKQEADNYQGQIRYIYDKSQFPVYHGQHIEYFNIGEDGYDTLMRELENAKEFIFLEYFIINKGVFWDSVHEVLKRKVKEGVEVRVMYDDIGSLMTLSSDFIENLEKEGIKAISFNRVNPRINVILNHRDHRKILVIDGKTAFTGGINLADEYINAIKRFGVWKDNILMFKGEAVWSLTIMFLTNWNALRKEDDDYEIFRRHADCPREGGYIAPYGETPLDTELTSQNVYLNIINQATRYVYIDTPYLIIDNEMTNALTLAANRGVDVRIVVPGIPDKKLIWYITKSYYGVLVRNGVKIYEYTPGFIHSKTFVCDDVVATVGTVNLDYRSLYLHFENGTYLYRTPIISEIKKDLLEQFAVSHQVIEEEIKNRSIFGNLLVSVIRIFAPLL